MNAQTRRCLIELAQELRNEPLGYNPLRRREQARAVEDAIAAALSQPAVETREETNLEAAAPATERDAILRLTHAKWCAVSRQWELPGDPAPVMCNTLADVLDAFGTQLAASPDAERESNTTTPLRQTYSISAPCSDRHPNQRSLYLEGESAKVIARVCPVCTKEWTEEELTDINNQMAALESNWKDYEYPPGARGHFTGD